MINFEWIETIYKSPIRADVRYMYICANKDLVISTLHTRKNIHELHYIKTTEKNNSVIISKQFDHYISAITH